MTNNNIFITATDTDAGKTLVAAAITQLLVKKSIKTAVFKPLSAGCDVINAELVNDDAAQLLAQSNSGQTLQQVNPFAFEEPIAPHIAASKLNMCISPEMVQEKLSLLEAVKPQVIITEGAGGWRLPMGNSRYLSEFVQAEKMQVILVVNMKLGCLNHAMLTVETIKTDGLSLIGWVANSPEPMDYLSENIQELKNLIDTPLLGQIGKIDLEDPIQKVAHAASCLDISPLL